MQLNSQLPTRPPRLRTVRFTISAQAASGNYRNSQQDMCKTFALSNMAPQDASMNRGIWNRLEQHVRQLADKSDIVFVCSGPLFLPAPISTSNELTVPTTGAQMTSQSQPNELWVQYRVIGDSHVAVPTHFFKASDRLSWCPTDTIHICKSPCFMEDATTPTRYH
eukprot:m.693520 g.693520  ORF g.693520 m.693520 type:complete len:165 (-) comp22873_c0_seq8:51-545(-)